jgi:hypothetical protein
MKEIKKKKIPSFFISMETDAKFVLPIPISLAYLVPLYVDMTGNITETLCEVWSEFNIFCTLVTMATAPFLFPWQLRQTLSNRFRSCWLIWFH